MNDYDELQQLMEGATIPNPANLHITDADVALGQPFNKCQVVLVRQQLKRAAFYRSCVTSISPRWASSKTYIPAARGELSSPWWLVWAHA